MRRCNIYLIGVPESKDRQNGKEVLFKELIHENYPELITNDSALNQEAQGTPGRIKKKKSWWANHSELSEQAKQRACL